ncbi:MAG: DegT/DnrJ/EryC1/StrS family aminotransferase [Patescibacteria group bacterium]
MIPVSRTHIPKKSVQLVTECLNSGWISGQGKYVEKFEKKFSQFVGTKYALATNSGTSALHLAILTLGIGPGDEVILPASTIASCFFAIWYTGAKAIPVDVTPDTYTINPQLIESHITKNTKAIMAVHLYGHPCDMDALVHLCHKHKLFLIEDAAEAHGAEYKGKKVGSFGDVSCFSFYANKLITTGEGGAVVTNSNSHHVLAKKLRTLYFSDQKRFIHDGIGYKYVMTNLQAALGLASLAEIKKSISFKKKMAELYQNHLYEIPGLILPIEKVNCSNVYWMYAICIEEKKFGMNRDQLMDILWNKYHIETRTFFYPPNIAFASLGVFSKQYFPIADKISQEGLYLPSGLGNTTEEFKAVCNAIQKISKTH